MLKNGFKSTTLAIAVKLGYIDHDTAAVADVPLSELNGIEPHAGWLVDAKLITEEQAARIEEAHQQQHPHDATIEATKRLRAAVRDHTRSIDRLDETLGRLAG